MQVKDVMTKGIVSVSPRTTVADALDVMTRSHFSGLPVVDEAGVLVGILSEADFMRRSELGTEGDENHWAEGFFFPAKAANIYARTHGRWVNEVMSVNVVTIDENAGLDEAIALMAKRRVKRLPVVAEGKVIGIITRGDFMRALARYVGKAPSTGIGKDALIKRDILAELQARNWAPVASIEVDVKDGVVNLGGSVTDERQRKAVVTVAENVDGVLSVTDGMIWVSAYADGAMLQRSY